jgi:hypothetical protein
MKDKSIFLNLDLQPILDKLIMHYEWDLEEASQAIKLYKNFLFLKKKYGKTHKLPPSKDIDEVWHLHILDTEKYACDCRKIFNEILHHYPYAGLPGSKMSVEKLQQQFALTQELHKQEFGYFIPKVRISVKELCKSFLEKFHEYV